MTIRYLGSYIDPDAKVELTCDGCGRIELSAMRTLRPFDEYAHDWLQLRGHPCTPAQRKGMGDFRPVHHVERHDFCTPKCLGLWSIEMYMRIKRAPANVFRDPETKQDEQGNRRCPKCDASIFSHWLAWACGCDAAYYVVGVDFGEDQ